MSEANFKNHIATTKQKFEGRPFVVKVAIDTTITQNDSIVKSYRIIINSKGMENRVSIKQTVDYSTIDLSKATLQTLDGKTLNFNDLNGKIKTSGQGVGLTKNSDGKLVANLDSHIRKEIEKLIKE